MYREELVNEQNWTENGKLGQNWTENGNLRKRIRQLEREKTELASKVRDLTIENQKLQNSLDTCNDQNGY